MRCGILPILVLSVTACSTGGPPRTQEELTDFATRYASARSSQDPRRLASFYAEDGVLQITDGDPSLEREAIAATAGEYKAAFSDMVVEMVAVGFKTGTATYQWHWTGTNTGPHGTGRAVDMTGYEEWTFDSEGRIAWSRGYLDQAEYDRQRSGDK